MLRNLMVCLIVAFSVFSCSREYMTDRSHDALISSSSVEVVANLPKPPGNITVSKDHRIFFSFHPEADPDIKVAELVNGKPVPFPNDDFQQERSEEPFFNTVLSMRVDSENQLWTLDHGYFGIGQPRLLAFNIRSRQVTHRYDFPSDIAGFGSFLNDFQIDPSGKTIYIADTGAPVPVIGGAPAIIIYDIENKTARRVLENHESVTASSLTLRIGEDDFELLGLFSIYIAVDSIALDRSGQWLYYAAVNSEKLYRIKTEHLIDPSLSEEALSSLVEPFADKTMSDGLTTDVEENIYISDMEHSAVHIIGPNRKLKTLLKDPKFRWPDGFSFGPDGWLYVTCSALMDVIGKDSSHIEENAPYQIFRFKPGYEGVPGH